MIYISKNNHSEIFTDNILDWIPEKLNIYFDDIYIGEFDNISSNKKYLRFIIPTSQLECREYQILIYSNKLKIKSELVVVIDFTEPPQITPETTNNIRFYENFDN